MRKFVIALGIIGGVAGFLAARVSSAGEIIQTDTLENKVFVLKHAVKGSAFVRVSDSEGLRRLVDEQGFEVVARQNDETGAVEPVIGDIVPQDELAQNSEEARLVSEAMGRKDPFDLGLGLNLGLTTGLKGRFMATLPNGIVVGVDLDIGTIIFITDWSVSALLGYSFQAGRHVIRPYVTVGGGGAAIFALIAIAEARFFHAGIGVEWKPVKWFGLGLEGGVNVYVGENITTTPLPYARLNVMFYFW